MFSRPQTPPNKDPWEDEDFRFKTNGTACEWGEGYHPGGYHPVHLGDTINERYRIIRKIGWGQFSTVWLAIDNIQDRYVSLKITLARQGDTSSKEVTLYKSCIGLRYQQLVSLLDVISITGPNGQHDGLVFETMGADLNIFLQKRPEFQIGDPWERRFTKGFAKRALLDIIQALNFLHGYGIVHGDIHLGNILTCIRTPDVTAESESDLRQQLSDTRPLKRLDGKGDLWAPSYLLEPQPLHDYFSYELQPLVKLADLGGGYLLTSSFMAAFEATHPIKGAAAVTPVALRAPETIFNDHLGRGIDIWSLGCLIFEMIIGRPLFVGVQSLEGKSYDETSNDEHLIQIWEVIGPLPKPLLQKWRRADQYFSASGERLQASGPGEGYDSQDESSQGHMDSDLGVEPKSMGEREEQASTPRSSEGDIPLTYLGSFDALEEQFNAEKPSDVEEPEAKDILHLLRWIFQYDPAQRPTTKDLLQHPWLSRA
ncbi:CMGC SRPK kinase [Fusarium heterosporum]|uniref:non-specific serine/threonine protein kinase n=1 Tax=Fusarium heterosporum TaxID=42747 RepID=A0A8H5SWW5_FUSHE|nr:CMGC SRPK kinase [Fusarium heterosporum]